MSGKPNVKQKRAFKKLLLNDEKGTTKVLDQPYGLGSWKRSDEVETLLFDFIQEIDRGMYRNLFRSFACGNSHNKLDYFE